MTAAKLNLSESRDLLQAFDFTKLFVDQLGWSRAASPTSKKIAVGELAIFQKQIAELGGVVVFEITTSTGTIPNAKQQAAIQKEISKTHYENLLIFLDKERSQSLWYWVKRDGKKSYPRPHLFVKGQPGDLFLSNIGSMVVDLGELDEHGNIAVTEVARRVKDALDVERVTKKFYEGYKTEHVRFVELIEGIDDERDRQWYASVLLNRLMFIYFLQRKFFIDKGDREYLQRRLESPPTSDSYWYYGKFLKTLFFEGFAKPESRRSAEARKLLGEIKFLNGGLFLPHAIEEKYGEAIRIKNEAFENILNLFKSYSWNLNDTPGEEDNEIRPDVLGYIFEKYINQKAFGAYYTRTEITEYLCEQTIDKLILDKVNDLLTGAGPGRKTSIKYETIADLLLNLDAFLCRQLLNNILPSLSILDPACGSGAFLVAALKTLIKTYSAVIGRIEFLNDRNLNHWLKEARREHPSVSYFIKKRIITDNLFGVDIMEEASEIAKLRLFLTLVASADTVDQLEPLPNIDFNLLTGNSLIGLMHVDDKDFDERHAQGNLFRKRYGELLAETKRKIETYRKSAAYSESLVSLRDEIDELKSETALTLNEILLSEFQKLGIKFEQATWDEKKHKENKSGRRALKLTDVTSLKPFHWGFEFDEIINNRGGFDAIITNPPWEIFKPNAKEFFQEYSDLVTKKKMSVHQFEKAQSKLLQDDEIREAWLKYLNSYPHVSSYFRSASQYKNQISLINGKKAGSDINLYKLFTEQCFNLLANAAYCGIVVPSGFYSALGTKQLRELLFTRSQITGLFCFENKKEIFEGVHRSDRFLVLTFEKGGVTKSFPAAFMRFDVAELERFPEEESLAISVDLIRQLSPDSLSVLEFKNQIELGSAETIAKHPTLDNSESSFRHVRFARELDPTASPKLFSDKPKKNMVPLMEGRNIHQFTDSFSTQYRSWILEKDARRLILGRIADKGQKLDYQTYRLAFRKIANKTNVRTMIATVIPPTLADENLQTTIVYDSGGDRLVSSADMLVLTAIFNSFVYDSIIRLKVSANMNFFYVYSTQIPRLTPTDAVYEQIMRGSARLICTTPPFDALAREVGFKSYKDGATQPEERARLRAELDGIIAHRYGLTEEEFTHILSTFPLVEKSVKDATLDAYRVLAPKAGDQEIAALIAQGEGNLVEFKSSARWDFKQNKQNKAMEEVVVKTVAAFLNTDGGDLLIGVGDERNLIGLAHDYKLFGKKDSRDAYENFLTTLLLGNFGKDTAALFSISIHELNGQDIARVAAKSSPRPVFVKDVTGEHLYIRAGNSTRLLSTREAIDYCKMHWP